MWFNFVMKNHGKTGDTDYLAPLTDYMRTVLGKCGHETTVVQDQLFPRAINVFFEFFIEPSFIEQVHALRQRHDLKVGVIATELMLGGTIPYGTHGMAWDGDKEAFFRHRVAGFDRFARGADFVWAWLERTAQEFRNHSRVCRYFPVGHVFDVPDFQRRAPKDIDVLFFGMLTPHRASVLESFRVAGMNVHCVGRGFPVGYLSKTYLSSLMDRARIGLNLNLHAANDSVNGVDPRFASCMRITEMLGREMCVVCEEIPLDNPYSDYMVSDAPERLAARCRQLLDSGDWQRSAELSAARFRTRMDAVELCKPIIDETLSVIHA